MRILHLLSQTELTGAETYAAQLVSMQERDGHQVQVISDKLHIPFKGKFHSMSVSTSSFWKRMKNIWTLRKFLKAENIQVIHCHSRGAVRHAYWARIGRPVALVTSLHGEQHFSWSKKVLHLYGEILIAVCENIKSSMSYKFGTLSSTIRVIRNPVQSPGTLTDKKQSPSLALAGRSSGPKGLHFQNLGLRYFKTWLSEIPNLKISIYAPHPERFSSPFQNHIEELNQIFPGQITLHGQIPKLAMRLKEYDLVIGSGRIAIEAILNKTALIAMGEHETRGLVNSQTYQKCLESNFGDIGNGIDQSLIDYDSVSHAVLDFFALPRPSQDQLERLAHQTEKDFSPENIHQQILEAYKAACFKRHYPKWIPVLMYHKVPDQELESRHRIFVTKENFKNHLQFFKKMGFTSLHFKDLTKFWDQEIPMSRFPKKPLILTFDDGYKDNLTTAQPLLKEMGFKATIFLLADHSIQENTWDADTGEKPHELMNLAEKKELDPQVFEVGSHGYHHWHLTEHKREAYQEMTLSKTILESDLKQPVVSFAYPYGSTDSELAEICQQAGYRFAVNTDQGGLHLADQPHSLFRVNIFPEETSWSLRKKTSPWYRKYFYKKRGR